MNRFRRSITAGLLLIFLVAACQAAPTGNLHPAPATAEGNAYWLDEWEERGQELYEQNCATCHGFEGEGRQGYFPALADSALVSGEESGVIILPMYGRGAMPSFSGILSDEEIALILSYIRSNWDNDGDIVSPEEVSVFREEGIEAPLQPILGGQA